VTLFPSVLCSPPPVYRNHKTPPIGSWEVPFPKCAFRQSPHKNNIDISCENKNQTSLSFSYLSFCQVLDSYSMISYIPQILSLPFSLWIRYLKPSGGMHYVKTSNRSHNICNGPLTPVTSTHICNGCSLAPVTYKRARTTLGLASTMPVTNVDFW
jgi:hypothetical protein